MPLFLLNTQSSFYVDTIRLAFFRHHTPKKTLQRVLSATKHHIDDLAEELACLDEDMEEILGSTQALQEHKKNLRQEPEPSWLDDDSNKSVDTLLETMGQVRLAQRHAEEKFRSVDNFILGVFSLETDLDLQSKLFSCEFHVHRESKSGVCEPDADCRFLHSYVATCFQTWIGLRIPPCIILKQQDLTHTEVQKLLHLTSFLKFSPLHKHSRHTSELDTPQLFFKRSSSSRDISFAKLQDTHLWFRQHFPDEDAFCQAASSHLRGS